MQPRGRSRLHRGSSCGKRVRDVPGITEPGRLQPRFERLPGSEAFRIEDEACGCVHDDAFDASGLEREGRTGLHGDRLEVRELPVPGELQRRAQLHPLRAEAPELWRPDRLHRRRAQVPCSYGALEAENQIGYKPIWVEDSASYTAAFAQWNTAGLGNNTYVRLSYEPLEAAKVVPAVGQYLAIVKKYGGLSSQLGEQATSSFLLWATQAKACSSTLTRQCMINKLSKVTSWTGGGLNASGNPSKNLPPNCGLLMKLQGTKWVQAYPKKLGTFDCSSKYIVQNTGSVVGTPLNAQRYATQYATSSVIKPQG